MLDRLFSPAVWLMGRFSYFYKTALLFVAVAVLLFSSVYLYTDRLAHEIAVGEKKLVGVQVNRALFNLLGSVGQYREKGYFCLHGGCETDTLEALGKHLGEKIGFIDAQLRTESYYGDIAALVRKCEQEMYLADVAFDAGDARLYFKRMTALVEHVIHLMDRINLYSIVLQEDDIRTLMRVDVVFDKLPRIAALSGELRGLGSASLQTGRIDPLTERQIIDLMGGLEIGWVQLMSRIRELSGDDAAVQNAVEEIVGALRTYDNWLQRDLFEGRLQDDPKEFFKKGSELLAKQKNLFELIVPRLHRDIMKHLETAREAKALITEALMLSSALWIYLFIGGYLSVRRSISNLIHVTDEVADGQLVARMQIQSDDEFKHIAGSMNHMIESLQAHHSLLGAYKRAVDDGTMLCKTDVDGKITYVNQAYEALCGYRLEELQGKTNSVLHSERTSEIQTQELWNTLLDKKVYRGVFENIKKNGERYFVESTIIPILDAKNNIVEFISIMSDITSLKAHEEKLEAQLYVDDLTGLPNRNALHEALSETDGIKLMLLDIDNFSMTNTIYGENVGDELIVQVSALVQNLLGNSGLRFFRLAGDEFAVLADRHITEANFHEDVIMISHYLNPAKLRCFAHEITIRVSIGAVIAARQESHRPVIAMAGIALKEAKKRPRSYYFYSETADESLQLEHNLTTIERLDYAIKQETVNCHYQPIFNVRTQRVEKFESLVRIVDREGEVHMPSTFIDIAKGARLYTKLTQQVVLNALAMAEFNPGMHFTINIDVEDIIDVQTTAFIFDQLRQSGSAERIVFELVESGESTGTRWSKAFSNSSRRSDAKSPSTISAAAIQTTPTW